MASKIPPAHLNLLAKLYEAKSRDFTFMFCDEQTILVNKRLLSILNPTFKDLFDGEWKNLSDVAVVDSPYEAFNAFIEYFNTGVIDVNAHNAASFMQLAKRYDVAGLGAKCTAFMATTMNPENAITLYGETIRKNLCEMNRNVEQFISENMIAVLKTGGFLSADVAVVQAILKLEQFQCPTIEVFDACIEWAKKQCEQNEIDPADGNNIKQELIKLKDHIRFEDIDYQHLVERCHLYEGGIFSTEQLYKLCVKPLDDEKQDAEKKKNNNKRKTTKTTFPFENIGPIPIVDKATHNIRFSVSESMKLMKVNVSNVIVNVQKDEGVPSTLTLQLIKDGEVKFDKTQKSMKSSYVNIDLDRGFTITKDATYEMKVTIETTKTPADKRIFVRVHQHDVKKDNDVEFRLGGSSADERGIICDLVFERYKETPAQESQIDDDGDGVVHPKRRLSMPRTPMLPAKRPNIPPTP